MKTFKQYQKVYEERKNKSVIASPIHFKYVESRGQIPSAIHFKGPENLKESGAGSYEEWRDTNENGKLGHTNKTILGKLTKGHNLTDDEKSGIYKYTKVSRKINKDLIDNVKPLPQHKKISSSIDSAIDRHPIQHGFHVYSGLSFDPTDHTDENGRMHSPAYISATHTKDVADSFTSKHRDVFHIARISLQPGDPAIHVSTYSHSAHEDETIIKRGVTLQHTGHQDYVDDKGQKHRIHNLSIVR